MILLSYSTEELVERYTPQAMAAAKRMWRRDDVRRIGEIDDIRQIALITLWRVILRYGDHPKIKHIAYKAAQQDIASEARKYAMIPCAQVLREEIVVVEPDANELSEESLLLLRRGIGTLYKSERIVIRHRCGLFGKQVLSYKQLALKLDMTPGGARLAFCRGIAKLREWLHENGRKEQLIGFLNRKRSSK